MKKNLVYLFIIFFSIIVQTSVLPVFMAQDTVGDGVLMLVLALSVLDGFSGFIGWAVTAGILYDLASYVSVGLHVLVFLLTTYSVSFFSRRFSVEFRGPGLLLFVVFIVFATLFSQTFVIFSSMGSVHFSLHELKMASGNFSDISLKIFYNIILFAIWFFLLKKIKRFFMLSA